MAPPRILVLEDDPAIQRFIALALMGQDLELLACHTLHEARAALTTAPVQLLLMDMTLPDGSGLELLHWIHEKLTFAASTLPVVVFSGGVNRAAEQQLLSQGAWRVLHKPASVSALLASVEDALSLSGAHQPVSKVELTEVIGDPASDFFAGNRALYMAYRAACLARFTLDVEQGNDAMRKGDMKALRRVTHNLKSVLRMLGHAELSMLAGAIEEAANRCDYSAQEQWPLLRAMLLQLASTPTPGG